MSKIYCADNKKNRENFLKATFAPVWCEGNQNTELARECEVNRGAGENIRVFDYNELSDIIESHREQCNKTENVTGVHRVKVRCYFSYGKAMSLIHEIDLKEKRDFYNENFEGGTE